MKTRTALLALTLGLLATDGWAGIEEGLSAYQRRDWPAALREFQPLAQSGDAVAQSRLGHMLLHGNGITKDVAQAVKLLTEAADKGDALAQNTLGPLFPRQRCAARPGPRPDPVQPCRRPEPAQCAQ